MRGTRLLAIVITAALTACGEAPSDPTPERVRAIKPYFVAEPAGGEIRRYSGTIAAANTSALSFAVTGTVQTVDVNAGDRVQQGQLLATLDTEPFDLAVEAARAEVTSAQARLDQSRNDLGRQRDLFDRGWVAQAALDQAQATFDAAQGDLNLARSRLGIAERDVANAGLTAPFDGVISAVDVDAFVEVQRGEPILQIDGQDAFEVELSIPDTVVGRLTVGAPVTFAVSAVGGCGCTGRITEIGAAASAANAVTVTAAIVDSPPSLLPGMAVDASVVFAEADGLSGFLVPVVALAEGDATADAYVFKYDPDAGVVRKTPVTGAGTISGNLIGISEGIAAGDIVAAAGVSFLRDGQRVKLLGAQ